MNKIKKLLKKTSTQKSIKIGISILFISIFFFQPTFAQTETANRMEEANKLINSLLEFFSRSWVLLASIAGKFMTNDMVYGSWLHLDAYLWKMRNISKNFANFGLIAILLRGIIQFISKKGESIQKLVTKTLISGIIIQASWFLIAAVLDISTILTAAIGTFPNNFMDKSGLDQKVIQELATSMHDHYLKIDREGHVEKINRKTDQNTNEEGNREKKFIEKLMPNSDSIAGPLVYIGATTLNIQKAISFDNDENTNKDTKSFVSSSALQLMMIGLYVLTLILLIIANIIRVALLWVFIPLSPIIILMITMGKGEKSSKGIMKNFNIGTILHAIFKPVLFTAALSIVLIFIVSMQNILNPKEGYIEIKGTTIGIEQGNGVASMENDGIFSVKINDTLFKDAQNTSKNIFSGLIVYFASIFMLRYIIKIAAEQGGGTIGETMEKATGTIEKMASTAPIFGGYSAQSLELGKDQVLKGLERPLGMGLTGSRKGKFDADERFKKLISGSLNKQTRTDRNYDDLNSSTDFIETTASMINGLDGDSFGKREKIFNEKLEKKELGLDDLEFTDGNPKTLENLTGPSLKELHISLGGDEKDAPTTYQDFKTRIEEKKYHNN